MPTPTGLSISRLANAMHAAYVARFGAAQDDTELMNYCTDTATAIVNEITANALVTVTSVTGVTIGSGVSGPGSGGVS